MKPRKITTDTRVVVTLLGEKGSYTLANTGGSPLSSWVGTLSDLTGYTVEHLTTQLVAELRQQYGVTLATAAGDLCPIRFLVTLEASSVPVPGRPS